MTCQCNVQLEIQKEASIVAGGADHDDPDEAIDGDHDDSILKQKFENKLILL